MEASLHAKTGRIHGCSRTLRKTSDSSCTAGAVHTWPEASVRCVAAKRPELGDEAGVKFSLFNDRLVINTAVFETQQRGSGGNA
jgi:hypothetical protein